MFNNVPLTQLYFLNFSLFLFYFIFNFCFDFDFFYLIYFSTHDQEPINRSLHVHCILESTFARIFLFLELPFLQEAQFYRENLSQSSSLKESSDLPAIIVTFRRDHFMWGKHAALFWLGILNSARESSHPQCSKNRKMRAKVDSEGLYGRGRLLFMGPCHDPHPRPTTFTHYPRLTTFSYTPGVREAS